MTQEIQNIMREIRLEKVVLNMGLGKSGDSVEIAKKALGQISGKKVNERPAKKAIRDWGVRKGEPIGAAVTVRGNDGKELLKRLLEAKGNKINGRSFDSMGNLSFGILEHIDIPGIKYDPKIGKIDEIKEGTFSIPKSLDITFDDRQVEIPARLVMPIGKDEPEIKIR